MGLGARQTLSLGMAVMEELILIGLFTLLFTAVAALLCIIGTAIVDLIWEAFK